MPALGEPIARCSARRLSQGTAALLLDRVGGRESFDPLLQVVCGRFREVTLDQSLVAEYVHGVPHRLPYWIRILLTLDRVVKRVARACELLRDELLFAWVSPETRSQTIAMLYSTRATYLPGGSRFEAGLFDWERRALTKPPFPKHGRVLLGGAGGGRELVELCTLNYGVVAFEPSPALAEGARRLAEQIPGAQVHQASYADLVRAVRHGEGPLAGAPLAGRFDAVILGWGSFSHLTDPDERAALLHAVHDLAPTAPVLLSWLPPPPPPGPNVAKVQRVLRNLFAALGAPSAWSPGEGFLPGAGFYTGLIQSQVAALAVGAGYRIVLEECWPYPHALLAPEDSGLASQ